VTRFYKAFYGANHGYAAFVGNIDQQAIKTFLDKNFSQFNTSQPYKEVEEKYFDVKGGIETIDIHDKTNAMTIGAVNIPLKQGDPEFVALDLANEMLGGGTFISSRIASRLRESEGMSYGAGSVLRFNYEFPASSWLVYAIFNPIYKSKLDSALHDEITKAITAGFRQDELKTSLSAWLQQRKAELGNDEGLASRLASYMSVGKDLEFFDTYQDAASKLTLDQVNAALKKYLSPDKITLIYAGDFSKK
jgi:zinc protease